MRLRYFAITSIVVIIVSLFSLSAHNFLAERDSQTNADILLKQTSETLTHADWANPERELQRVESMLAQEMGSSELNRFFIVKDAKGKLLYKSRMAAIAGLEDLATFPEWQRIIKDDWRIRVLNLSDPRFPDRILQVGLITNQESSNRFNDFTLVILFLSIGALGMLSSWLLANLLFSPIAKLGYFLNTATEALEKRGILPNVPKDFFRFLGKKDELHLLTEDLDSLLNKINTNYKTSRLWASQMAHELKTPLSQLLLHIEATSPENHPNTEKSYAYITRINNTINAFLDWAELENRTQSRANEKVDLSEQLKMTINLTERENRDRIVLKEEDKPQVACNPQHFVQVLQNLLSNALKYSNGKVTVTLTSFALTVADEGAGIPVDVIEKVGDPFNFGNSKMQKKGHGLGLAWVKTICRLYDWKLSVQPSPKGTRVIVEFNKQKLLRAAEPR